MSDFIAVVLAAGKGTRMKSAMPKVLHQVGGKPMLEHVLAAAEAAGALRNIAVIGFGAESVREALGQKAEFVVQEQQLGTGHAVLQAREKLAGFAGTVMVLYGDTPLLTPALLSRLYAAHREAGAAATVLTAFLADPAGYGRVIRDDTGQVLKIVEQKDATPAEAAGNEINTGIYCFDNRLLFRALDRVGCNNKQGEY